MKYTSILLVILCLFLCSCTKNNIKIDPDNLLVGYWNFAGNQNYASVYKRSSGFSDNYGYKFNSDGTLIQRKNSGWCGTPPVSYADYSGNWSILNDTLVHIMVDYWGGNESYYLDIESVTSDSLKFETVVANN